MGNIINIVCDKKYMILPASFNAQNKRLLFYDDEKLVYDLVVALDYDEPDYQFPVNIERFAGKTLRVMCDQEIDIKIETSDEAAFDYSGKYRPVAHFTTKRGWINDPNGLVYANGQYHMYYQHNPVATTWENMHWGFAESTDLVHWKEKGDVLFPDEYGTIFSGSGIIDKKNVTGFKNGENDTILFFYTCAGNTSQTSKGKPFTQNLAYSIDGGNTLVKYEKPLINQIAFENRDPKVIYYEPDDCYILVMFLEGHEFAMFKSSNLLDWSEIQRITLPNDWECPDFYPLLTEDEVEKWIFSAASDRYYIGNFDGERYEIESDEQRLNYGNAFYAAQSFSNAPDGRRIRTAFAKTVIPGMPFGCCMNIPQEMKLKRINNELKLCAEPVAEIKKLYSDTVSFEEVSIQADNSFKHKIDGKSCDILIKIKANTSFSIALYGLAISYNASEATIKCMEQVAPIDIEDDYVTLRIIYDTIYTEIYAGSAFMGMTYIQDSMLNTLTISSDDSYVDKLVVAQLSEFYK